MFVGDLQRKGERFEKEAAVHDTHCHQRGWADCVSRRPAKQKRTVGVRGSCAWHSLFLDGDGKIVPAIILQRKRDRFERRVVVDGMIRIIRPTTAQRWITRSMEKDDGGKRNITSSALSEKMLFEKVGGR